MTTQTRSEPNRDRWGRYLLPDPDTGEEKAWTRATTIAGLLDDTYNLERWAERMVVVGLAKRDDLMLLAKSVTDPNSKNGKGTLNRIVKDAKQVTPSRANVGTAIHAATEAVDRGEIPNLPAPYDKDLDAYTVAMHALGITVEPGFIERIVVLPELEVAGTLDRMVRVPGWDLPVIADIKTGATVHFAELSHAIQQSIYANATHVWDPELGELVPMPPVDKTRALIVHLPAGEGVCQVHVLDIAQGIEAARVAAAVHKWRKAKGLSTPLGEQEDS
jgi:hypothetical protein